MRERFADAVPRYKLLVMSKPAPGRESEYNNWYQNLHLHQLLTLDDVQSAQRFRLTQTLTDGEVFPYLAIYDVTTDNPAGLLEEIKSRAESAVFTMSDALDADLHAALYEEFGEVVKS